jgi:hypothetical protein
MQPTPMLFLLTYVTQNDARESCVIVAANSPTEARTNAEEIYRVYKGWKFISNQPILGYNFSPLNTGHIVTSLEAAVGRTA